ncbi:MAG: response regulator [Sphingomonadales bacterium]|nr:response regulator [Sphingomonadales bacterium]
MPGATGRFASLIAAAASSEQSHAALSLPHAYRPGPALGLVFAACVLVWGLLALETAERDWIDWPFHVATALAQLAIWIVALRMLRQWRRQADRDRAHVAQLADLLRAKETAESVNQAKSRYLANVSHEIRSPLNSIYGYAQLVESDYGVEAREAARVIRRCAEHMSSLIEGLLDISQVEHGVLRVNTETVRLEPFLTQVMRMAQPGATAKGLRLDLVTEGRLPEFVRLDQGRLRQVLINLLTNAIKYTDRGAVTLYLRYVGQIATFEVRDTGPGIPAADRETIFDPFERGHGEQVSRPGAGLGLSIARAITGILGGSLELAQSTAKGSVFRVTMMLGEVVGTVVEAQSHRQISGYHGPERRVLLVDDDAEQRGFVAHLLTRIGFDVTSAGDGRAALAIAAQADFDLAILDITMPGLSGWQVAAAIRDLQPKGAAGDDAVGQFGRDARAGIPQPASRSFPDKAGRIHRADRGDRRPAQPAMGGGQAGRATSRFRRLRPRPRLVTRPRRPHRPPARPAAHRLPARHRGGDRQAGTRSATPRPATV